MILFQQREDQKRLQIMMLNTRKNVKEIGEQTTVNYIAIIWKHRKNISCLNVLKLVGEIVCVLYSAHFIWQLFPKGPL